MRSALHHHADRVLRALVWRKADKPRDGVLPAMQAGLRGAGLSRDDSAGEARPPCRAAILIDDLPKAPAQQLEVFGRDCVQQAGQNLRLRGNQELPRPVQHLASGLRRHRLDHARPVGGAAISQRRVGHDELEGRYEVIPLPDRDVRGVGGGPSLLRIVLLQPSGTRKDPRLLAIEPDIGGLPEPEHVTDRGDRINAGGIPVLIEKRVARHFHRVAERQRSVPAAAPALEVVVAIGHAAAAVERSLYQPFAQTCEGGHDLECRSRRERADGAVDQRVGLVLGQLLPVSRRDAGNEGIGIKGRNRSHREDLAVIRIDHDGTRATHASQGLLRDELDAGINGKIDSISGARGVLPELLRDDSLRAALHEPHPRRASEPVVHGQFDLRLAFHIGVVKIELLHIGHPGNIRRLPDIAEDVRGHGAKRVLPHGPHGHLHAGHAELVLTKLRERGEVHVLQAGKRDLGIDAEMPREAVVGVIDRQPKSVQFRPDRFIDDLNDVRLLEHSGHCPDLAHVAAHRHCPAVVLPVVPHHLRQVKLHVITRAIPNEDHPIAVADLTAHRRYAHPDRTAGLLAGCIGRPIGDLHLPQAPAQGRESHGHEDSEKPKAETGARMAHRNAPVSVVLIGGEFHAARRSRECHRAGR